MVQFYIKPLSLPDHCQDQCWRMRSGPFVHRLPLKKALLPAPASRLIIFFYRLRLPLKSPGSQEPFLGGSGTGSLQISLTAPAPYIFLLAPALSKDSSYPKLVRIYFKLSRLIYRLNLSPDSTTDLPAYLNWVETVPLTSLLT